MDEQIKRLADLDIDNILLKNDPHFDLGELRSNLELLKVGAQKLLDYEGYWQELPKPVQTMVVDETRTLMRVIDEISGTKDNTSWLASNLEPRKQSIANLYDKLYPYYVIGIREYENTTDSARQQVQELLREIKSSKKSAESANVKATAAAANIQDVASDAATVKLSHYFDLIANGDPDALQQVRNDYPKTSTVRRWFLEGYKYAATRWLWGVMLFVLITGAMAYAILHDVSSLDNIEEVLAKALVLAAPAYGIRFCAKNYRDNKALQAANIHRAAVMKTLLAFLERPGIDEATRNQIIAEAASQAFKLDLLTGGTEGDTVFEIPKLK